MKLYVTKKLSKEKKPYFCLCADLGYRVAILSMDLNLCVEMSGKTFNEVANLEVDKQLVIGSVLVKV